MSYLTEIRETISTRSNDVLKQAFFLVALSMIPTILGALVAAHLGLPVFMAAHPVIAFVLYLGISAIIFMLIHAAEYTMGSMLFLVFAGMTGAVLSTLVTFAATTNGPSIISFAALGTAIITGVCSLYAMTTTRDFSSFGGYLVGALLAVILLGLLNIWLQLPLLTFGLAVIGLLLFSAFLVYDVQQVVNGGETNPVMAAIQIYLDVVNIFVKLVQIIQFIGDGD